MSRWVFLLPVLFVSLAAGAEEQPAAPTDASVVPATMPGSEHIFSAEERAQMTAKANQLNAEAKERRSNAEKAHEAAKVECWKKFLVSACLDDARTVYRKEVSSIMVMEREARSLERDVRRHEAADHAVKLEQRNAQRDAEMDAKAERYRARKAEDDARREKKAQERPAD